MSIYDYSYTSIDGKKVEMKDYEGKVLLIVNTASECGFTPQYTGLQVLYDDFASKGFVVIGFPCNQFGGQEPGSNATIGDFCVKNHGVTFPLSEKVDVNGPHKAPIFNYLVEQTTFKDFGDKELEKLLHEKFGINFDDNTIKWNFTKFLISKDGKTIMRFEPPTTPEELVPYIEDMLKK